MTKLGDMFHTPVTDRLNKRRPCVQKTIGRSGTLFCHFLLILVLARYSCTHHRLRLCTVFGILLEALHATTQR
jgi:hypothetical protein